VSPNQAEFLRAIGETPVEEQVIGEVRLAK